MIPITAAVIAAIVMDAIVVGAVVVAIVEVAGVAGVDAGFAEHFEDGRLLHRTLSLYMDKPIDYVSSG